jgi:hypothetical protein
VDPYFDGLGLLRASMSWSVATRLQLDRWERLVAENLRHQFDQDAVKMPGALIWQAQFEHHFCVIAARHLLRSLELMDHRVPVDLTMSAEIREGRDLHEHWDENMPVFNVRPRTATPPRKSGKDFAARNPNAGPYWWLGWDSRAGPRLLPHVIAAELHRLIDEVQRVAVAEHSDFADYVLPRAPSPWVADPETHGWWPRGRDG